MKKLIFISAFLIILRGGAYAQGSVTPEEFNAMLAAKSKAVVVDVRPAGQYIAGHIAVVGTV